MGCSRCGNSGCGGGSSCCGNTVSLHRSTGSGSCASACPEDHTQYICDEKFNTTVVIANSWNIPDCGESAVLAAGDIGHVHEGSYLWSADYGYYEITAHDKVAGEITVKNNCTSGNEDAGTQVPAGSSFIVSDPPASSVSAQASLYPFVAVSFTAPNVGVPTLVSVTNVNGLSIGKNVNIGSGTYLLTGISDANTIEIENTGSGITPGTAVNAVNSGGDLQYPVILIDANPCTNDATESGSVIGCASGVLTPFDVPYVGSVLVGTDAVNNLAEFQLLDLPTRTCSPINNCCVTLVPGTYSYVIPVGDSSIYQVGDLVQLGSRSDRFTITEIIDSGNIRATVDTNPSSIQVIPAGTSVCLAGCCELVSAQLQEIIDSFDGELSPCSDFQNRVILVAGNTLAPLPVGTLSNSNQNMDSVTEFTFENESACREMMVLISLPIIIRGFATNTNTNSLRVRVSTDISLNGAAYVASQQYTSVLHAETNSSVDHTFAIPYSQTYTVPVATTRTFRIRNTLTFTGAAGPTFQIETWAQIGNAIGVAV